MKRSNVIAVVMGLVLVTIVAGVGLLFRTIHLMNDAEQCYQSWRFVCAAVADRLDSQSGSWPNSWDELYSHPPRDWPANAIPDRAMTQHYITIDFHTSCAEVARAGESNFSAIRPANGMFDGQYEDGVHQVVAAAQQACRPVSVGKISAEQTHEHSR